jgi:hypothetical protein
MICHCEFAEKAEIEKLLKKAITQLPTPKTQKGKFINISSYHILHKPRRQTERQISKINGFLDFTGRATHINAVYRKVTFK